ncbi:Fe(3+)-hydroxamate ABC transporter permease FhuB [Pararobbsia silviterrae]|uniref:Fe(3+)-hydroxamate ABC transporter permease FhuB n=2 Tax=Pararobbsia silviterrae TaxID=1792498 RepID=A0A494Y5B3_9BURK|nr:Fe(3+)-hydroxamate ABC transporter permease FhuB [Pararobbsia silviterrae]
MLTLSTRTGTDRPTLRIALGLFALAAMLCAYRLHTLAPLSEWARALVAPDPLDARQLLLHDSAFPRIAVCLLCGAALGLAGAVMQHVLRNPLAEPTTLGVFPGAYLAVAVATVFAPSWLDAGRELVALAGAGLALALTLAIAARRGLSTLSLILGGMIVNLCCSATSLALAILYYDKLELLNVWCGGAMAQQDWHVAGGLLIRFVPCLACIGVLMRPLSALDAGDDVAMGLGVPLRATRALALGITLLITAFVVSAVGVVGFVGLGAPALARLAGARRLRDRMIWAPCLGAALLWLADDIAQALSGTRGVLVPTGAVTAFVGAPLMLALIPRLRRNVARPAAATSTPRPAMRAIDHAGMPSRAIAICVSLTLLALALSIGVSRDAHGWHVDTAAYVGSVLDLRMPHAIAALSVGVLLALAGAILQRMTANPMASPDLLGLSAGGTLGVTLALFASQAPDARVLLEGCALGCAATLGVLLVVARRTAQSPDALLLAGLAITTLLQGVSTLAMASGNPRLMVLLNLLVGSTYGVTPWMAACVAAFAAVALAGVPLIRRWLDIAPLGAPVARSLGLDVASCRLVLVAWSALMTMAATLVVGPLSFAGLIAPHIARSLGARRPLALLYASAAIGACMLCVSDWLARWVMFPRDMPAGVIASLIGSGYLIVRMIARDTHDA